MRAVRVAAGVVALVAAGGACAPPKKKVGGPSPFISDEDRLEWGRGGATVVVIRKAWRTPDVYRYGHRIPGDPRRFGGAGMQERKLYAGDHRTPTGLYMIIAERPHERWGYFFLLDYPNSQDASRYRAGLADGTVPIYGGGAPGLGSAVGIHGTDKPWLNRGLVDWTCGCISLNNDATADFASMRGS